MATLHRSHKIRLNPTQAQEAHFLQACGVARFAYNWALAEWQRQYEAHKLDANLAKPSEGALRRQLNSIKREQFPWMLEVTKCAPQEAIIQLGVAYKNWFASLSGKRKGPKVQAPKFKKKGVAKDAFKIHGGSVSIEDSRIRIPLLGWVRMREPLRFSGKPVSVTISRTANAWFAAITVETEEAPDRCESQASVGVDLGLKTLATCSDGSVFLGPKALGQLMSRLKRLSRAHSRKVKGSANRKKSAAKLAKLHMRIANVRNDALHKLTSTLTTSYGWIAIEDLNVKGMMANRRLARHIADASFGEFRRQLQYKAELRQVQLATVNRFFPSSKTCSACGLINQELMLKDREWTCECGAHHDRDLNAAKNILAKSVSDAAIKQEPSAGEVEVACGENGSGSKRKPRVKPVSMKQEVKHKLAGRPSYD